MDKAVKMNSFANGNVYLLKTHDGYPIEVTDTFLPWYTKSAVGKHQNKLTSEDTGTRAERWMIGVSTMSGCPVGCKFCATGRLKRWRNLSAEEIVDQVLFVLNSRSECPKDSQEFKINYTRMGEPFLNIHEVKKAIKIIDGMHPNVHHYVSTIGLKGADYSFIRDNITLQFSVHSFDESQRDWLIPHKGKISLAEMGEVRTDSNLKTTINLTMCNESDFNGLLLQRYFDKEHFFIKLSPINPNDVSEENKMGLGIITGV